MHRQSILAWKKAGNTDRWTEILFRALTARVAKRWRFVSFRGESGGEWRGVVDVLAIRKNTSRPAHPLLKSGDLFEFILVQMKGGRARRPSHEEIQRLRLVARRYGARAIVLYAWKRQERSDFFALKRGEWKPSTREELFG